MKIETERLVLREFQKSDLDLVYEYISDPKASMYMTWQDRMTKRDTARFIKRSIAYHEQKPRKNYELAITIKSNNQLIGGCGIRVQSYHHKKADIGYIINRKYWAHGFATEAAWALVRFGFDKLMLHRIFATCDVKNSASIRILEKIGMTREGLFREDFFINGRWRSSYMYSILEKEYLSIKETLK